MDLLIWGSVLLAFLCSLYWFLSRRYSYWKERGIPYVQALPMVGSNASAFFRPLHELERERYEQHGRLYGMFEGIRPTLTCANPEFLKSILVKDFPYFTSRRNIQVGDPITDNMVSILNGEKWKRVRNLMTPAFTTGKIKRMTNMILDSAKAVCENCDKYARDGEPADMKRIFGAFTMDVIASTAFATKVDSHNDPNNKFVQQARLVFSRNVPIRFILFIIFPSLFRFLKLSIFAKGPTKFFTDVTLRIIEERKRTGQSRNDFLQLMMEAADEQERIEEQEKSEKPIEENGSVRSHKGLTQNELVAQCVLFFLAGYDTTASTLSFAAYEMALNPDLQERLIEEIDEVIAENKGELTYEGVQNMKYLDKVISETLRKYPPAIRLERMADDDYKLGDSDLVVPKGMIIGVPVYAMHYDPEFFPEPEKFDPERFSAESKSERHQFAYLPFGAGPRNCVGLRFALMEIKLCLARFFSEFRVKRCPETRVPLEFYSGQGLLQPKEVVLSFERRSDVPA